MHKALNIFPNLLGLASRHLASGESSNRVYIIDSSDINVYRLDKYKKLHIMQNKNFFTKTRWLVTILLLSLCIGNVWGYTGVFRKITSTSDLVTGYYVVVGSENATQVISGNTVANPNYALGDTKITNNRIGGVSVSITSDTIISNPGDAIVYLITKTNSNYTFQNYNTSKYLYQSGTTSGKGMNFQNSSQNFTLAGYNSNSPKGFKFTLNGGSNNIFKYNNQNMYFANYSGNYSTSMTPVRLYRLAYKITYDGNGNTGGTVPTDNKYYFTGETPSAKTNSGSLAKTGYTFSGWNTQADGNGTDIAVGGAVTIASANITLYAKWVAAGTSVSLTKAGQTNGSFLRTYGFSVISYCKKTTYYTFANITKFDFVKSIPR